MYSSPRPKVLGSQASSARKRAAVLQTRSSCSMNDPGVCSTLTRMCSTFLFSFLPLGNDPFTRRVSFINVVIVCILFTYHFPQNKHKIDTSRRPLKKSERSGVSRSMSSSGRTLRGSTSMRCVEGKVNLLTQKLSSTPRSNERARRGDRDFTSNGVEYFV